MNEEKFAWTQMPFYCLSLITILVNTNIKQYEIILNMFVSVLKETHFSCVQPMNWTFPPSQEALKVQSLTKTVFAAVNALSQMLSPSECVWNLNSLIGHKLLVSGWLSSYENMLLC